MLEHLLKVNGGSKENVFVAAAANSKLDVLKALLKEGVDINCKDTRYGNTALHQAASVGSKKTAQFLIENGAFINSINAIDMTPLMDACSKGKKKGSEVVLLLLKYGADARHVREDDGMTAYKFALWGQCSPEALDALIAAGACLPEADFRIIHLT